MSGILRVARKTTSATGGLSLRERTCFREAKGGIVFAATLKYLSVAFRNKSARFGLLKPFPETGHRGMSLLELILALGLCVIVFSAITVAIQTNMVGLSKQQIRIERKQIARAALTMVSNDCRAAIQHKAADYSGLDNLIKSQEMMVSDALGGNPGNLTASAAGGGGSNSNDEDGSVGTGSTGTGSAGTGSTGTGSAGTGSTGTGSTGTGSTGSGADGGSTSGAAVDETEEPESLYVEGLVSFRPILVGTSTALMMDISRIPRIDQYSPLIASAASLAQSPSDIKSIAYFFSEADGGIESELEFSTAAKGGLYRREVDRAVAAYVSEPREMSSPDNFTKLVSPEIAEIEFRYFDGNEWRSAWNSVEEGGFPLAIEVTIVIDPARTSRNNLTYSYKGFDQQNMEMFRTVIHLPLSEVPPTEE
jgi:hypothetical protein